MICRAKIQLNFHISLRILSLKSEFRGIFLNLYIFSVRYFAQSMQRNKNWLHFDVKTVEITSFLTKVSAGFSAEILKN